MVWQHVRKGDMQKGWIRMDIFDKIGDTLVSVSKDATQKAKDLSDLAKIRMDMRTKQEYISKQYTEIGKAYYEKHKNDEEPKYEQVTSIREAEEVLDELRQQLSQIKGLQKCPECGQDMPLEADYCSKCGAKLSIFEEED